MESDADVQEHVCDLTRSCKIPRPRKRWKRETGMFKIEGCWIEVGCLIEVENKIVWHQIAETEDDDPETQIAETEDDVGPASSSHEVEEATQRPNTIPNTKKKQKEMKHGCSHFFVACQSI